MRKFCRYTMTRMIPLGKTSFRKNFSYGAGSHIARGKNSLLSLERNVIDSTEFLLIVGYYIESSAKPLGR